jgi:hypothetical protein
MRNLAIRVAKMMIPIVIVIVGGLMMAEMNRLAAAEVNRLAAEVNHLAAAEAATLAAAEVNHLAAAEAETLAVAQLHKIMPTMLGAKLDRRSKVRRMCKT